MLNPGQIKSLQDYLRGLSSATQQRGKVYALGGRVHSLKKLPRINTYQASVEGTNRYETILGEDRHGWWSDCDCPVGANCKHGAAMGYLLLSSNPAKNVHRPRRKNFFESHLLTPPSPHLLAQVTALQEAWENYQRGQRDINRDTLKAIFASWPASGKKVYELFPEKDLEASQFWHFLLHFAREHHVSSAPDFGLLNDITSTLPLIESVGQNKEISFWNKAFDQARSGAAGLQKNVLQLRLKIDVSGGKIIPQSFHSKKRKFTDLDQELRAVITQGNQRHFFSSPVENLICRYIQMEDQSFLSPPAQGNLNPAAAQLLLQIFQLNGAGDHVVDHAEKPLPFQDDPLTWKWTGTAGKKERLGLSLAKASEENRFLEGKIIHLASTPPCCITAHSIHPAPAFFALKNPVQLPLSIPVESVLSGNGIQSLHELGCPVPPQIASKSRRVEPRLQVRMHMGELHGEPQCLLDFKAMDGDREAARLNDGIWEPIPLSTKTKDFAYYDFYRLDEAFDWINTWPGWYRDNDQSLVAEVLKNFPQQFMDWAADKPTHVELECDHELASLLKDPVRGIWQVEMTPSGVDWFDLSTSLKVDDTELTPEELNLLLQAKGALVRIKGKGWKRLVVSDENTIFNQMRELGIDPQADPRTKHRLHTLQLEGSRLVEENDGEVGQAIRKRAEELRSFTAPQLPSTIQATMRPYQLEGFHFLARLSHCNLGGILADDMGLGKTLQTLAWLAWLHANRTQLSPTLVVCPKSVTDNWISEAARFFPELPTSKIETRDAKALRRELARGGLLVINYVQLRLMETMLLPIQWQAVILDEGQFIKNPVSKTALAANRLKADHRVVLTGTPIENSLLDLWSQIHFAMPGALPNRAAFQRQFNEKNNPLARQSLARRIRPFLLRRTKVQVAPDLPPRIEEDLHCELEGTQLALYQAHLKDARQILLKIKTERDLDKSRFNILTTLLRLRQACCHPKLIHKEAETGEPSAKIEAMLDLLEPLMAEGQKVLVFSQFVEMLGILRGHLAEHQYPTYYLDGKSEDRSALVNSFQKHNGPAVFLISLKAGGSGLNLTAASYVILFDPWWNPAVEAQAIDRTHRIGQNQTVIAYRLIAKNTIEEKIRQLQLQKTKLFQDVLGEENFAKALSLEDFRYLLADSD